MGYLSKYFFTDIEECFVFCLFYFLLRVRIPKVLYINVDPHSNNAKTELYVLLRIVVPIKKSLQSQHVLIAEQNEILSIVLTFTESFVYILDL